MRAGREGKMKDILIEILKELKMIRAHLETITGKEFLAGRRFGF